MLLKPTHLTSEGITSEAFKRRQPKANGDNPDAEGISLSVRDDRTESELIEQDVSRFNRCYGVGKISVGSIRNSVTGFMIDVFRDEQYHALLKGLPELPPDLSTPEGQIAQRDAEYVGNELRKHAELVWSPSGK